MLIGLRKSWNRNDNTFFREIPYHFLYYRQRPLDRLLKITLPAAVKHSQLCLKIYQAKSTLQNDFKAMLTLPGKLSGENDFGIFGNARNDTKWIYRTVLTVCKDINQILNI